MCRACKNSMDARGKGHAWQVQESKALQAFGGQGRCART